MKFQSMMKPQDIVILLKILTIEDPNWQYRDLAAQLFISISEISQSLNRSHFANLIDGRKRGVHRQSLMQFIHYGLRYVYPAHPGIIVTGIPTAHSYPYYSNQFVSELNYVWPDEDGNMRGSAIHPLYSSVAKAVKNDELLYQLLASIDILRVGRAREIKVAIDVLEKAIL